MISSRTFFLVWLSLTLLGIVITWACLSNGSTVVGIVAMLFVVAWYIPNAVRYFMAWRAER